MAEWAKGCSKNQTSIVSLFSTARSIQESSEARETSLVHFKFLLAAHNHFLVFHVFRNGFYRDLLHNLTKVRGKADREFYYNKWCPLAFI